MQEPFEPPPAETNGRARAAATADEIVAAPEGPDAFDPALSHAGRDAPLREIAHAFRLNAEALHTLKQMQGDLARSVKRGDRSELVLQSTRALNETFRNLTAVQRELLGRMHRTEGGGRGPLIPLMLLGLLVVVLAGVYVILDAVEKQKPAGPAFDPAEIARRERDSWKDGRREGEQQADREIKRLQEDLEEAKGRRQKLQAEMDAKSDQLAGLERGKRAAEMERDEFAGQVRKAQNEIVAKKALEDEITTLRMKLDAAQKITEQVEQDLQLQRSRNAFLRERLADSGMGISADDPPWRPGVPAGVDPATGKPYAPPTSGEVDEVERLRLLNLATRPKPEERKTNAELLREYTERAKGPAPDRMGDSSVPPPAPEQPALAPGTLPPGTLPRNLLAPPASTPAPPSSAAPATTPRRGAAYGGDAPPAAAPAATSADQVRAHLNGLLRRPSGAGEGWTVTHIGGVTNDALGGVTMQRYDASGRMVESIEAKDVRIAVDRATQRVQFLFREGLRYDRGVRAAIPPDGIPLIVAQGAETSAWAGSTLPVIKTR